MFRSLMTIIRVLYLYRTKVIFMLKHPVKLPSLYILDYVAACLRAARVLCAVQNETSLILHCTRHQIYIYIHTQRRNFTECFNLNITLVRYR